ncbi:hypothetical protein CEXT_82181 [Caerostris extrusa]|uniref:Uncharacterized protein n=1 Tax=Caerostris extrusa TaxID=172846 RepID=A0AAV4QJX6_CAEEX|nr:hypothetical protein CEXT_82181 [Caerostris extrusa]
MRCTNDGLTVYSVIVHVSGFQRKDFHPQLPIPTATSPTTKQKENLKMPWGNCVPLRQENFSYEGGKKGSFNGLQFPSCLKASSLGNGCLLDTVSLNR